MRANEATPDGRALGAGNSFVQNQQINIYNIDDPEELDKAWKELLERAEERG
jgi:hypothetical protein